MTKQLYLVPLPEAQTTQPPTSGVSARVNAQGLIQQAGIATEKIATENVDLSVDGQYRAGEFSKKLSRELRSLGESDYQALPFADDANVAADDQSGYYELQSVDVNRAHQASQLTYEYTLGLEHKGTRETHWRAVATNSETINTGLATGSGGLIGVPAEASKTRWFDTAQGTEVASVSSTVSAEFGDVDLFDPSASTFADPTLLYELPFDREGPVDVRVWDDVGESDKYATYTDSSGTDHDIVQWVHAWNPAFEFEGKPITDNGLLRLQFDEANGQIVATEWDDANTTWASLSTVGGSSTDYELFDADLEAYGPAEGTIYTEWQDTSDDSIHAAVLHIQRGIDRAVVRDPAGGDIPSDLETLLSPIASDQTTDQQPGQTVVSRGDVK